MHILVTGATGFIGRHLVPVLLERGHSVIVAVRNADRAGMFPWFGQVRIEQCDIHDSFAAPFDRLGKPDALIHLAWPGLPNYKDRIHIEKTFPADFRFLEAIIEGGLNRLLVTGTCLEYGMQNGCLGEDTPALPTNPYAQAKNALRCALEELQTRHDFVLQWARLFYTYGEGQNPGSLLAQLDRAIDNGEPVFNMSAGEQIRDYLPVKDIAHRLAVLSEYPQCKGIINICSGKPISVMDLVRRHISQRKASIHLNPGYYPYLDYEPMSFWGSPAKYENAMASRTGIVRNNS